MKFRFLNRRPRSIGKQQRGTRRFSMYLINLQARWSIFIQELFNLINFRVERLWKFWVFLIMVYWVTQWFSYFATLMRSNHSKGHLISEWLLVSSIFKKNNAKIWWISSLEFGKWLNQTMNFPFYANYVR